MVLCLFSAVFLWRLKVSVEASPTTIYVPTDYPTIQEAIDHADHGDTVFVHKGTYYENIQVNESLRLIGDNCADTTIEGYSNESTVRITMDNVTVSGFTITSRTMENNGVTIEYAVNCNLSYNIVKNNMVGVTLIASSNDYVEENTITTNSITGLGLYGSSNTTIFRNIITYNGQRDFYNPYGSGILFRDMPSDCENNVVSQNTILDNARGFFLNDSGIVVPMVVGVMPINQFYHNNFVRNVKQVDGTFPSYIWDNRYPSGGNYWSDYVGVDNYGGIYQNESWSDGLGDTSHIVDAQEGYSTDSYPLGGTFLDVNASLGFHAQTICNSTISDFNFDDREGTLTFKVAGEYGTAGFCRIMIPRLLMEPYGVIIDGRLINSTELPFSNSTHAFLYFTYVHSSHEIAIVPRDLYLYYDLLDKYDALLSNYNLFLANFNMLNASYWQHLQAYSNLQGNYTLLQTTSNYLVTDFNNLAQAYNILNLTLAQNSSDLSNKYQMLNSSTMNLNESFMNLNQSYINLNQSFSDYKTSMQNDLSFTRNLVYVLTAITIILVVAVVYLVIRKSNMKPEATQSAN